MGIFQQFPYSNFHEMNLDQIIKIMRDMQDEWTNTKSEWASYKEFIDNYFENLNVSEEVLAAMRIFAEDGTLNDILDPTIITQTTAWLGDHITQPTTPAIDSSLTIAGAAADAKAAGDAIGKNTKQIIENNAFNVIQDIAGNNEIKSGISYTWNGNTCTVYGTASAQNFNTIFGSNTAIPANMEKGQRYYVDFEASKVEFEIIEMNSGGGIVQYLHGGSHSGWFDVPANISGMVIRLLVRNGSVVNEDVTPKITNCYGNEVLQDILENKTAMYKGSLAASSDLNDVGFGIYLLASNRNYVNSPIPNQRYGTLLSFIEDNITCQIVYDAVLSRCILRHGINNVFSAWKDVADPFVDDLVANTDLNSVGSGVWLMPSGRNYLNTPIVDTQYGTLICYKEDNVTFQICYAGGSDNGKSYVRSWINNNYRNWQTATGGGTQIFNEYSNTYNVSASPTITTDTNSYLAPTGDTTDVTNSIVAMLTTTGVCRLGKGDYYVENLVMPDNTQLIGCGAATRVILISGSNKFAVAPKDNCVVKDLSIVGSLTAITPISTVRDRHGILWQGTYTDDQQAPERSIVSNIYISGFEGGGITCYDTGYGTVNALEVTNVYVWNCDAGINISYWSEYHKFTNIRSGSCYYGCINNGGNNAFVNCDFSGNTLAFLMDNGLQQSPNNSHGMCVGCVFNHTNNNTGIGIKIVNCDNGFVFTGCQIFYSQIHIEDAYGVSFTSCNFGVSNCDITILNGGTMLFIGNLHQGLPTITVTNNANVHFVNCYDRANGSVIAP